MHSVEHANEQNNKLITVVCAQKRGFKSKIFSENNTYKLFFGYIKSLQVFVLSQ